MIKVDNGHVSISSTNIGSLVAELTILIKAIRELITEKYDEELADEMIANSGRLAYMTEEEVAKEAEAMQTLWDRMREEI